MVNFEHISHIVVVFLLSTSNMYLTAGLILIDSWIDFSNNFGLIFIIKLRLERKWFKLSILVSVQWNFMTF